MNKEDWKKGREAWEKVKKDAEQALIKMDEDYATALTNAKKQAEIDIEQANLYLSAIDEKIKECEGNGE